MSRDQGFSVISDFSGGLNTRQVPLIAESASIKRMESPVIRNVDLFPLGSIAKRLGKTKQGNSVITLNTVASQVVTDSFFLANTAGTSRIAQKFTASASGNVSTIDFSIASSDIGISFLGTAYIYSDSAGTPNASLGAVGSTSVNYAASTAPTATFSGTGVVAVTSGVAYWVVIEYPSTNHAFSNALVGASGSVKFFVSPSWFTTGSNSLVYIVYIDSTSGSIQGIYDYRYGSASTQKVMAAGAGQLFYKNGSSWTSLLSGFGSGQNVLWAFTTLKDYLFTLDNGTNQGRVWNGSAAYTTKMGFRATFAQSDGGAGALADGVYKILAVTTLKSGGFRASAEGSVTLAGGGSIITVDSIVMDGTSATDFGFDIDALATKWFMTAVGASVYYKIPTANISTGTNPNANNVTTFNITSVTGLTAANTLLDEYGLQQAYFTTQLAAPTGKYLAVFQNMLAMGGDASYPSRVWFSGLSDGTLLAGPQIWGTNGGVYGNYRDLDVQDGEVIVGLKEWNGNLYAFKRHSVHVISFTGVAGNPFETRRLTGNIGALSHWSIKETPNGLAFISERGPAICTGTQVSIIPGATNILDRFDLNNTSAYNLAAMQYTTGGNNSTKMQIQWGVSSTSATTRDITLVYDYEKNCFWENDVSANYYAEVTDSNFFPAVWSGDYSAQVFRHDYGTSDNGSAINFYFQTPNLSFGKPFNVKTIDHLFVAGIVQSSGTLTVAVYTDMSTTAAVTVTYDMSKAAFIKGMNIPLNLTCTYVRFQLSNSTLNVPVQINEMGFGWQDKGLRV